MGGELSDLQKARTRYEPRVPRVLREPVERIVIEEGETPGCVGDEKSIRSLFPKTFGYPLLRLGEGDGSRAPEPLRIGVVLSGGQAPGGHNVIAGLLDGARSAHPDSAVLGFIGGPKGILDGNFTDITPEVVEPYRNTGGFDLIGSGRDKIENPEQLRLSEVTCGKLELDGLVIVGGDDSNTNAAVLAEYFMEKGIGTRVIGVPKTIDGDLQDDHVEISFGFDTATKVYSELIGNICRDAASSRKYWHFIKLMGRSASHVTLECALDTRPNIALIGEEIREQGTSFETIVRTIADVVRRRAAAGKNYGVCLVPEGLIEFIPGFTDLIRDLNDVMARFDDTLQKLERWDDRREFVADKLRSEHRALFDTLPEVITKSLLLERDSHGNLQVSLIETEKLLIDGVKRTLATLAAEGDYDGKFATQPHFFGYEGRCAAPSNFDADYTYALGRLAALLVHFGKSGYMCSIANLSAPAESWVPAGVPISSMLNMETRKGNRKPVIRKALVRTSDPAFRELAEHRERWAEGDDYIFPGAIQYFGPPDVCDRPPRTVVLNRRSH
jgi:pyrophosphate--fructose-6-phosphate 1-phosphotransferase